MISYKKFKNKTKTRFNKFYSGLLHSIKNKLVFFAAINLLITLFQYIYIRLRFEFINELIPFWYTKLWGSYQLAPKTNIYLIPVISLILTFAGLVLLLLLNKYFIRYIHNVILLFTIVANFLLTISVVRIVFIASVPFEPLVSPLYLSLALPFVVAFGFTNFLLPKFVQLAHEKKLVTHPDVHLHPGMLLQKPSARGGGVFYALAFLLLTIVFTGFQRDLAGFYLAIVMLSVLAFVDDFQNTHPDSDFRLVENPILRLIFLFSVVSLVVVSGVTITEIGTLSSILASFSSIISMIVTAVWIVWVLNVLSWSNGIDGQYGGIVGIASVILAILALRFEVLEPIHYQTAVMAAISAGIAFGFTRFTWHPSKVMWGFGAMLAGLVLSTLSILINAKIITSVLIVLIPFIDASVTVLRRLMQRKNPLKADRGHLHHILLQRGWSIGKIALFYWITTAIFGIIGLFSAERNTLQVAFVAVGFVAFFIVLLNVSFYNGRKEAEE